MIRLWKQVERRDLPQAISPVDEPSRVPRQRGGIAGDIGDQLRTQFEESIHNALFKSSTRRVDQYDIRFCIQIRDHILGQSLIKLHVLELIQVEGKVLACRWG